GFRWRETASEATAANGGRGRRRRRHEGQKRRQALFEAMEPRLLLSATPVTFALADFANGDGDSYVVRHFDDSGTNRIGLFRDEASATALASAAEGDVSRIVIVASSNAETVRVRLDSLFGSTAAADIRFEGGNALDRLFLETGAAGMQAAEWLVSAVAGYDYAVSFFDADALAVGEPDPNPANTQTVHLGGAFADVTLADPLGSIVFNGTGGADLIRLADDAAAGFSALSIGAAPAAFGPDTAAPAGATLRFAAPTNRLVVDAGAGDDVVWVAGVDAAMRTTTDTLDVRATGGSDTVRLDLAGYAGASTDLTLSGAALGNRTVGTTAFGLELTIGDTENLIADARGYAAMFDASAFAGDMALWTDASGATIRLGSGAVDLVAFDGGGADAAALAPSATGRIEIDVSRLGGPAAELRTNGSAIDLAILGAGNADVAVLADFDAALHGAAALDFVAGGRAALEGALDGLENLLAGLFAEQLFDLAIPLVQLVSDEVGALPLDLGDLLRVQELTTDLIDEMRAAIPGATALGFAAAVMRGARFTYSDEAGSPGAVVRPDFSFGLPHIRLTPVGDGLVLGVGVEAAANGTVKFDLGAEAGFAGLALDADIALGASIAGHLPIGVGTGGFISSRTSPSTSRHCSMRRSRRQPSISA
ncbi:MAG: LEPR-XLL domain-containing protein, partial [Alphaproteobacteria bacterium]